MKIPFQKTPSPCYILDEQLLRRNLSLIKSVSEQSGAEIILAFKGFAMWGVFPIVREYISGATASSLYEARLAFEEMGRCAHTYAPAYKETEITELTHYSSHITFNSIAQYNTFAKKIKKAKPAIEFGLRVNPEYSEVKTLLYNPCAPGTRLGIISSQMPDKLPEGVTGLHFHTLCESDSEDLEKTLKAFELKFGRFFKQLKWVNFGGGHLMTRQGYNIDKLISIIKDFKQRTGLHVILEPGSAFAWETGYLRSTVLDIVENYGISTAILDISFTAHMPDCLEMPYQPKILGALEPTKGKPTYRIGGNSCLAGDWMGEWSFDKPLQIGDTIVFNDMIHYTMVKTNMFNGIHHPTIAMWSADNKYIEFKQFDYFDYKNRLS